MRIYFYLREKYFIKISHPGVQDKMLVFIANPKFEFYKVRRLIPVRFLETGSCRY